MRICGRTEITDRFYKRIQGHLQKSRFMFRQKIQKKREHADHVYECGESDLRNYVHVEGEKFEGWRTAGGVGKAARNMFPVVNEDFDPFIIMEGVS
jgi:hypothetical protein